MLLIFGIVVITATATIWHLYSDRKYLVKQYDQLLEESCQLRKHAMECRTKLRRLKGWLETSTDAETRSMILDVVLNETEEERLESILNYEFI